MWKCPWAKHWTLSAPGGLGQLHNNSSISEAFTFVLLEANRRVFHQIPGQLEQWLSRTALFCNSSSPCCSLHKPDTMKWGFPCSALRYASLFLGRLLPRQPHRLSAVPVAPLFRRHHGGIGSRILPANRRDPLWRPWILDSWKHALQLEERCVSSSCFMKLLRWWIVQMLLWGWIQPELCLATETENDQWFVVAGVWLTDLVHIATHEIGHVLGLMHSLDPKAIMHLNATLTGRKLITQDEVWGLHRLYGMLTSTLCQCKIKFLFGGVHKWRNHGANALNWSNLSKIIGINGKCCCISIGSVAAPENF